MSSSSQVKDKSTGSPDERFGRAVRGLLDQRGWHSIPRRELTIQFLHLADQAGIIELSSPRVQLAQRLKIAPGALDALIRDRALLLTQLPKMSLADFEDWARSNDQTTEEDNRHKRFCFVVNSTERQLQVKLFLEDLKLTPDYKNNRRLLLLDLGHLLDRLLLSDQDTATALLNEVLKNAEHRQTILANKNRNRRGLLEGLVVAIREQADQRVGSKTVDFALDIVRALHKSAN